MKMFLLLSSMILSIVFCCAIQYHFSKTEYDLQNSIKKSIEKYKEELNQNKLEENNKISSLEAENNKRIQSLKKEYEDKFTTFSKQQEKNFSNFTNRLEQQKLDNEHKRKILHKRNLIALNRANEIEDFKNLGLIPYNTQGVTKIGLCCVESIQPSEKDKEKFLIKYHNVSSQKCKPKFKILFYDKNLKCCGIVEKKHWEIKSLKNLLNKSARYTGLNPGEYYQENKSLKIKGFAPCYLRIVREERGSEGD